jgi:hypothetical protein
VAVVHGHVYNNPVLGQAATVPPSPPLANQDCDGLLDLGKFETPPDLFEAVLNEDAANGMNSNEFKEFIRNLSYSSKRLSFFLLHSELICSWNKAFNKMAKFILYYR